MRDAWCVNGHAFVSGDGAAQSLCGGGEGCGQGGAGGAAALGPVGAATAAPADALTGQAHEGAHVGGDAGGAGEGELRFVAGPAEKGDAAGSPGQARGQCFHGGGVPVIRAKQCYDYAKAADLLRFGVQPPGLGGDQCFLRRPQRPAGLLGLLGEALGRLQQLVFAGGEVADQGLQQLLLAVVVGQGAPGAEEGQPRRAAAVALGAGDFDQADLGGAAQVGAATGGAVEIGDVHYAKRPLDLGRAAQRQRGQFGGVHEASRQGVIVGDDPVGQQLGGGQLVGGDVGAVEVNGAGLGAQVEADGFGGEGADAGLGEDVLAGVLLHVVEAAGPVQAPVDFTGGQFGGQQVERAFVGRLDVQDGDVVEVAEVAGLAAALRVEGGAVEDHGGLAIYLQALHNASTKLAQIRIIVVQKVGHG